MQKSYGPAQKCGGPTQKCGIGASQKGFALWAPKVQHACGAKCGSKWHVPTTTCAPACGKGCGAPKGCGCGGGLFGRLHFGHGCGCGQAKGGCGTAVIKGGYGKAIYGSPIEGDMPVPAEVTEEPMVPTPAPIVPPAAEQSARRLYSLFN
jgi:hypothetical protein